MSNWIDKNKKYPESEYIICLSYPYSWISQYIESKWGNGYKPIDNKYRTLEWTYWIECPKLPEEQ